MCYLGIVGWRRPDTAKLAGHRKHDHRPRQAATPDQPAAVGDPNQADLGSGLRRARAEQARRLEVLGDLCGVMVGASSRSAGSRMRPPCASETRWGMDRPGVVTASTSATVSGCGSAGSWPTAGSGSFDVGNMIGPDVAWRARHADRQPLTADAFQDLTIGPTVMVGAAPTVGRMGELVARGPDAIAMLAPASRSRNLHPPRHLAQRRRPAPPRPRRLPGDHHRPAPGQPAPAPPHAPATATHLPSRGQIDPSLANVTSSHPAPLEAPAPHTANHQPPLRHPHRPRRLHPCSDLPRRHHPRRSRTQPSPRRARMTGKTMPRHPAGQLRWHDADHPLAT